MGPEFNRNVNHFSLLAHFQLNTFYFSICIQNESWKINLNFKWNNLLKNKKLKEISILICLLFSRSAVSYLLQNVNDVQRYYFVYSNVLSIHFATVLCVCFARFGRIIHNEIGKCERVKAFFFDFGDRKINK